MGENTHSFGAVKNSSENMTLGLLQPPFTCAYHSLCMFYWLFTETLLCCACFTGCLLRLCYAVHVLLAVGCLLRLLCCACFTGCLLRLCYAVHVLLAVYWDSAMLYMFYWLFTETLLCCASTRILDTRQYERHFGPMVCKMSSQLLNGPAQ